MLSKHVPNNKGYAATKIGGRYVRLHRGVLEHRIGRMLTKEEGSVSYMPSSLMHQP